MKFASKQCHLQALKNIGIYRQRKNNSIYEAMEMAVKSLEIVKSQSYLDIACCGFGIPIKLRMKIRQCWLTATERRNVL